MDEIEMEDIVGVWRSDNFVENSSKIFPDVYAAVYITDDGNLYILQTSDTSNGANTQVYHYHYEVVNGRLVLTPVSSPIMFGCSMENVQITFSDNIMRLDMRQAMTRGSMNHDAFLFTLYKATSEVPYGWTNIDRQEMEAMNARVTHEIRYFAGRFGEKLGIPITLSGRPWRFGIPFTMSFSNNPLVINENLIITDDIEVNIRFMGETPTPTQPQRHMHVVEGFPRVLQFEAARSANHQFALFHSGVVRFDDGVRRNFDIPNEWYNVFNTIEDIIDW